MNPGYHLRSDLSPFEQVALLQWFSGIDIGLGDLAFILALAPNTLGLSGTPSVGESLAAAVAIVTSLSASITVG